MFYHGVSFLASYAFYLFFLILIYKSISYFLFHLFYCPMTRLTKEDINLLNNFDKQINPLVISVSVGTLLGDAHCEKRSQNGNARLTIKQSTKHAEWFFWIFDVYAKNNLCNPSLPVIKKSSLKYNNEDKNYSYYKFNTYSTLLFGSLHRLFYDSTNKKVLDIQ